MTNVGFATLDVVPSFSSFGSLLSRQTNTAMGAAGKSGGKLFSSSFAKVVGGAGLLGAAFGIAGFVKDSVTLEAQFSRTMGQIKVATKAPADEMARLDKLAVDLGKSTIFSALDASDAMLALAKNGIKPATIEAGALQSALTLAAAGGVDMETAANVMGNALNAFGLKGKDSASVAAALAGAANASSADIGSLAQGLGQASTVAADAGLNIQETTGILAAFAKAGIGGSDAGTSLKTMLSRLVPQTDKAAAAMGSLGIKFTKPNGEFKNALQIAEELKTGLGKLSDEERTTALNTIFGSDARRGATILMNQGADGLKKFIKATSDQTQAEKLAKANMEGTAGAIERLKGAWETAKLEFGKSIAPVVADFLDFLAGKIDDVAPKLVDFGDWFTSKGVPKLKRFAGFVKDDVLPILETLGGFAKTAAGHAADLVEAFNGMPEWARKAVIGGGATALVANKLLPKGAIGGALSAGRGLLGSVKPIPVIVTNPGFGAPGGGLGGKLGTVGKGAAGGGIAVAGGATIAVAGAVAFTIAGAALNAYLAKVQAERFAADSQTPSGLNPGARVLTGRGFGSADPDAQARRYVNLNNQIDLSKAKLTQLRDAQLKYNSAVDKTPRQATTLFKSRGHQKVMVEIQQIKDAIAAGFTSVTDLTPRGFGADGVTSAGQFTGPITVNANNPKDFEEWGNRKRRHRNGGGR